SVGSRLAEGSYGGCASRDNIDVSVTPGPSICQRLSGGKHWVPTRTATLVPRRPPAGKTWVLPGSREGTGCARMADALTPTKLSTIANRRTRNGWLTANHLFNDVFGTTT